MELFQQFLDFLEKNQILLTALGLGGAGAIIFWIKGIPLAIYNFLKRELTTEMTVSNQNRIFYDVLKLIERMYKDRNLRKWKLTNGRWGEDDVIFSMGYGTHLLWYKRVPILVTLMKESANQTNLEKDSLLFLKFGRGHVIFEKFIQDAEKSPKKELYSRVYKLDESYWNFTKEQRKRSLDSIFIEKDKKDILLTRLNQFIGDESWYLQHGIPYQLGILLYGPPGTGKTSLIRAISAYMNYSIYYLPVVRLSKIEAATAALPENCIMVIEDIDSNFATTNRNYRNSRKSKKAPVLQEDDEIWENLGKTGLSEILNALDGFFSSHGRILIATTNHIDQLDPALIRPGRFDIKVEIGYVNHEILKLFLDSFFPDNNLNIDNLKLIDNLTIATLQNYILSGLDIQTIINIISEES